MQLSVICCCTGFVQHLLLAAYTGLVQHMNTARPAGAQMNTTTMRRFFKKLVRGSMFASANACRLLCCCTGFVQHLDTGQVQPARSAGPNSVKTAAIPILFDKVMSSVSSGAAVYRHLCLCCKHRVCTRCRFSQVHIARLAGPNQANIVCR